MPARKPALLLFAVLAAVVCTYANHFQNGFHFDDSHTVVDNPYIRTLGNIPRFFTDPTTFSVLPSNRTWRPLVSTSLAIDYALGQGYVPFWFHLSTFLLYLLQLFLMARLFRAILHRASPDTAQRNELTSLFAVAWYGLHPAIAETVNYVIQRGDIFSAAGVVGALALYVLFPLRRATGAYLVPFALGLLSKPPALVFPALLFAYVYLFEDTHQPRRLRSAAWKSLPSLVLCLLLLALQAKLTPKSFAPSIIPPSAYRLTQPFVWLRYVSALFLPLHLNVDTDLQPLTSFDVRMAAGLLFVALWLALIAWTSRKQELRPISFGLLWFALAQLPTSLYALSEVENDHRMYFAFIGLVLAASHAAALALDRLLSTNQRAALSLRRWSTAFALLFLAGYAYGTFARNQVWRDEASLWKDDVEKSPHNGRGLMNYGLVLMSAGDGPGALALFTRALRETPNYPTLEINLGVVNGMLNRTAESERHFLRAIALAPTSGEAHFYYARELKQERRYQEAQAQASQAIQLNPSLLAAHHLLMEIDHALGDDAAARAVAGAALKLLPGDTESLDFLAHPPARTADDWLELSLRAYQAQRYEECAQAAREVLKLNPRSAEAYNNLAAAAAARQRWDEAIEAARQALQLRPDFTLAKNNLAWAESEKAKAAR